MQALENFKDRVEGRRSKSNTIANRKRDLECFGEWLEEQGIDNPEEIWIAEIEDYISYLGGQDYSGQVLQHRWWTLNIFFNELVRRNELEENPLEKVNKDHYRDIFNKSKKEEYVDARGGIYALEEEGIQELADNVNNPVTRNKLIILLGYHTGCRRQELADIKLENIDRQERRIEVYSKKKDSQYVNDEAWRPVWYGPSLDPLMDTWIEVERKGYATADSPYLFVSHKSERLRDETINDVVRDAAENSGLQQQMYVDNKGDPRYLITSHVLRHSFARSCMTPDETGNRIDVKRLAELMGHSDSSVTAAKYLHFAEDDVKEARELYGPR